VVSSVIEATAQLKRPVSAEKALAASEKLQVKSISMLEGEDLAV